MEGIFESLDILYFFPQLKQSGLIELIKSKKDIVLSYNGKQNGTRTNHTLGLDDNEYYFSKDELTPKELIWVKIIDDEKDSEPIIFLISKIFNKSVNSYIPINEMNGAYYCTKAYEKSKNKLKETPVHIANENDNFENNYNNVSDDERFSIVSSIMSSSQIGSNNSINLHEYIIKSQLFKSKRIAHSSIIRLIVAIIITILTACSLIGKKFLINSYQYDCFHK